MSAFRVAGAVGFLLTGCQANGVGSFPGSQTIYPIEYVAEHSDAPRPILGFFSDQFYQSYDNRPFSNRLNSESRGGLSVALESGAYITDFVPIFVPSKEKTSVTREKFSCSSADEGSVSQIDCKVLGSGRHFRSAYKAGAGFLWFEALCYPENERTCRYVPVVPTKLLFSPSMTAGFK